MKYDSRSNAYFCFTSEIIWFAFVIQQNNTFQNNKTFRSKLMSSQFTHYKSSRNNCKKNLFMKQIAMSNLTSVSSCFWCRFIPSALYSLISLLGFLFLHILTIFQVSYAFQYVNVVVVVQRIFTANVFHFPFVLLLQRIT